jgi:tRNA(fMet)-specific endonuclease VapC
VTEHDRGLLDTSVVVALGEADESGLPRRCLVSAITLAELSAGPLVAKTDSERMARQSVLQQVEADFDPIPFDDRAARAFGRVAAQLRASGRKRSARAYDALIAATAVANGLPVYTRNPADFTGIDGLEVVTLPPTGSASST